MTDLMQHLYNYAMETRVCAYLNTQEYQELEESIAQSAEALHSLLTAAQWQAAQKHQAILDILESCAMEATFQAAWDMAKEVL